MAHGLTRQGAQTSFPRMNQTTILHHIGLPEATYSSDHPQSHGI